MIVILAIANTLVNANLWKQLDPDQGTKPLARYSVPETWWLPEHLVRAMLTVGG